MEKWLGVTVASILGIVIVITVLTSLGSTVITQTTTNTGSDLENVTATGKVAYSLVELLYPIMGVVFVVGMALTFKGRI